MRRWGHSGRAPSTCPRREVPLHSGSGIFMSRANTSRLQTHSARPQEAPPGRGGLHSPDPRGAERPPEAGGGRGPLAAPPHLFRIQGCFVGEQLAHRVPALLVPPWDPGQRHLTMGPGCAQPSEARQAEESHGHPRGQGCHRTERVGGLGRQGVVTPPSRSAVSARRGDGDVNKKQQRGQNSDALRHGRPSRRRSHLRLKGHHTPSSRTAKRMAGISTFCACDTLSGRETTHAETGRGRRAADEGAPRSGSRTRTVTAGDPSARRPRGSPRGHTEPTALQVSPVATPPKPHAGHRNVETPRSGFTDQSSGRKA